MTNYAMFYKTNGGDKQFYLIILLYPEINKFWDYFSVKPFLCRNIIWFW